MASIQTSWLPAIPERDFSGRRDGGFAFDHPQRLPPVSELARPGRTGALPSVYAPLRTHDRRMDPPSSLGDAYGASGHSREDYAQDLYTGQSTYVGASDLGTYTTENYVAQSYHQPQYRAHAPAPLATNYNLSPTALYGHSQYANSVSSLASSAGSNSPYDPGANTSAFAHIKGSSLSTANGSYGFAATDTASQAATYHYSELDRRPSNLSLASSYSSGFPDNYSSLGFDSMDKHFYEPSEAYTTGSHHTQSTTPEIVAETVQATLPQSAHAAPGDAAPNYDGYDSVEVPYVPSIDSMLAEVRFQKNAASPDLETFMRPFLDQYAHAQNRLAFGERTIIVMTSKVAQKSYGTEKRFLCPPPSALLLGNSWWSSSNIGDADKLRPPRVVISIPGEAPPPETNVDWCDANGKPFNLYDPPTGTTYVGRGTGGKLFISDADERRKKVEAVVTVMAPVSDDGVDRVIGEFTSRAIKVISKPSKKRQSAKNLELCVNHGTTVSLFHRLRSQTVSTRYLCVSSSTSAIKGSDGAQLVGLDARIQTATPSFVAKTSAWDAFVLYIVDLKKETSSKDPPPPPPQPDFPSPPPNAIPYTNNGSPIPVYYNQTVVLQCLTSGVVSPVLIIRKVDHSTVALGGGGSESGRAHSDAYCAPGEVCGDPVSQLHKIAFEVFDPRAQAPPAGFPGDSSPFLSCSGEKVNTHRPIDGRRWAARADDSPVLAPASPLAASSSYGSMIDYFGGVGLNNSAPASPVTAEFAFSTHDGGRVKKKRSTSSANSGGLRSGGRGSRRRPQSSGSGSPGHHELGDASSASYANGGAHWQVEIGETSVWTIVGVDQVRYNFWVPPVLFDGQHALQGRSFPVPSTPVTPFPNVLRYLRADRAAEIVRHHPSAATNGHPDAHKMLTLYGENFSRAAPPRVFFGAEPSPFVEVRCTEVVGCLPPNDEAAAQAERRPIILVRGDGVVYPSSTMYP